MSRVRTAFAACAATALACAVVGSPAPALAADNDTVPVSQVQADQWWLSKLNIEAAWPQSKQGAGVKVGVLDSGIDRTHRDLTGAVVAGKDFSGEGSADGSPLSGDPDPYHGTVMAGFIAGRGTDKGLLGVAPRASILSASIGFRSSDAAAGQGLRWLVDQGAKVINMSFEGEFSIADLAYAQAHDVVLVAGTGNEGASHVEGVNPPARYLGVVAVGGVDKNLATDPGSSYGGPEAAPDGGDKFGDFTGGVAVAGPYGDVPGDFTQQVGMVSLAKNSGYTRTQGTSNATAVVSGIVALIRAAHPELNAANVINRLGRTAEHFNPTRGKGYDKYQGFGVVNAAAAVANSVPTVCENPFGSLAPPQSMGLWTNINNYQAKSCPGTISSGASPTSGAPSTSSSSSAPTAGALPANPSSSSGVPVWVWPVIAVVVLGAAAVVVMLRRSRRPAGGAHAPGSAPPPGWGGGQQ